MHPSLKPCFLRTCLALTVALPIAAQFEAAAVIRYTAEEVVLGFLPSAMNNRRWIVGASGERPMRYRPGVGTEQISEFPGNLLDINDAGTAVGTLRLDGRVQAIIRPAGAPWKQIGTLGGLESAARAINEAGQVVGRSKNARGEDRAFIYTEAEGMKLLVDQWGSASDINEAGQILGSYSSTVGWHVTYLWDPSLGLIDIRAHAGTDGFFENGRLADNGTVAALHWSESLSSSRLATFSLANGLKRLGAPLDGSIRPAATNDRGWIVGPPLGYRGTAYLYVYGQGVRDLNSLVAPLPRPLTNAIDINDRDEILASTASPRQYYILKRVRE